MRHAALRRSRDRFRKRWLQQLDLSCDQCPAPANEPCYPACPYVRTYGYPARRDTP